MRYSIGLTLAACLAAAGWLPMTASAAGACAGRPACTETRSFVAEVTNFRTSRDGKNRVASATVRFQNRTKKPLTLGYVAQSGVALDELGNRYVVAGPGAVRALGEVSGAAIDRKFTLEPGESGDARLEFTWDPGKAKAGEKFDVEFAVREIAASGTDAPTLGAEHALFFAGVGTTSAGAAASTGVAAKAAPADPCGGAPRCFNAGTFLAEVVNVAPSAVTAGVRHHTVTLTVRFRNIGTAPAVLAYRKGSSAGADNFGNVFAFGRPGTHDTSAKGIGYVDGRQADPQFTLQPGQSRNATFQLIRFNAVPPIGQTFRWDAVVDELELLPGQQIVSARQNSLSFTNLAPGTWSGVPGTTAAAGVGAADASGSADPAAVINQVNDTANAAQRFLDAFKKKP